MGNVKIDYQLLNQIAGSLKNLSVDLAAETTWEDMLEESVSMVWDGTTATIPKEAVSTMIGDWDYVRSVLSLQTMNAAQKADAIGEGYAGWDAGAGVPGSTALETGDWGNAGGLA